jgi:hypothetical protein
VQRAFCGGVVERLPWLVSANKRRGGVLMKRRNARLAGVATLVFVCLLGALVLAAVRTANGGAGKPLMSPSAGHAPVSASAMAFHDAMRKLWEDHITYTRNVIISFELNEPNPSTVLPDLGTVVNRLLQNQVDIGDAIKPYYGDAAGDQLTALLQEHISGAARVLTALKSGDQSGLQTALGAWYANAHDIAVFLSNANPANWPLAEMDQMMKDHLDTTTQEALARHDASWSEDVAAYDKVHEVALEMADMLSDGIIAQFANQFRP